MVRFLILIICLAAIGLALTIGAAGPGSRLGLWDYGTGLSLIRNLALPTMVAAGASVLALLLALIKERGLFFLALIAALGAGAASYVPVQMRADFTANPFIHDITTDFDNPPQIDAAADLPRKNPARYAGDNPVPNRQDGQTTAEAQRAAFPDIAPIELGGDVQSVAARVRAVIGEMNMEILADGPISAFGADSEIWRIEAAHTSPFFGFIDDFIVRLTPQENGTVRVDMRSKSRVGGSDLGANAKRVRDFAARLKG